MRLSTTCVPSISALYCSSPPLGHKPPSAVHGIGIIRLLDEAPKMPGESDSPIFKLLIEEYKSLREEIGRFQNQEKQLVIAAIAGVGAIGAGFLKENSITEKYADFFLLGPLFFGTIGVLFLQAERGIYRAAYYTGIELRKRAEGPCKTILGVLEWERFRVTNEEKLGETERPECTAPQFLPFYLPPILLFGIPSVLCFVAFFCFGGLSKSHDDSMLHRTGEVILGSVGLLIFFSYCLSFWKTSVDGKTLNARAVSLPDRVGDTKSPTIHAFEIASVSSLEREIKLRLVWWLCFQAGLLTVSALIFRYRLSEVDPWFPIQLSAATLIGMLTSLLFWRTVRAAQAAQSKLPEIGGREPRLPGLRSFLLEYPDLLLAIAFIWSIVGLAAILPGFQHIILRFAPLVLWLIGAASVSGSIVLRIVGNWQRIKKIRWWTNG